MEKRVLYITAIGASANSFLKGHFRTLGENAFRVALASTRDAESERVVQETGIEHFAFKLSTQISPARDLLALFSLINIIRRYKPFVVHAHMSKAGLVGMLSAWLCRTPVRLYHNHGMAYFSSQGLRKTLLGIIERCNCWCATEVIFCSQSTLDDAVGRGFCPANKASLIGAGTISGVDTRVYKPRETHETQEEIQNRFTLPPGVPVVGFVGRIVSHKGIDTLLSAWDQLPDETADQRILLICGKHDNNELYQRLLDATQRHPNIRYVGRQEDIANIYKCMDILVLPSWHEGFPYSVLEAQSCAVPAIVSNVSGNIDAVVNEQTGLIVEPGSPEELATAIEHLLAQPELRRHYGTNARDRVVQHYSQATVMNNLKRKYDTLFQDTAA